MVGGFLVERGAENLGPGAIDLGAHVGDLLRPLVDQQDEELALRVVVQDAPCYLLQEDGLTCAWWRDDETALPLADGGDQVEDAHGKVIRAGLQDKTLAGVDGRQVLEADDRS